MLASTKQKSQRACIVIGNSSANVLAIAREIAPTSVDIYMLYDVTAEVTRLSKYIYKICHISEWTKSILLSEINSIAESYDTPIGILFTNESQMQLLSEVEQELPPNVVFVNSPTTLVQWTDKEQQQHLADKSGFTEIPTQYFSTESEGRELLAAMDYPIICRPVSQRADGKSFRAEIIDSPAQLDSALQNICQAGHRLMAQPHLGTTNTISWTYMCSVDSQQNLIAECTFKIELKWPRGFGTMAVGKTEQSEEFLQLCRQYMRQMKVSGIFGIEAIYCEKRKQFFFIEINLRSDASQGICSKYLPMNLISYNNAVVEGQQAIDRHKRPVPDGALWINGEKILRLCLGSLKTREPRNFFTYVGYLFSLRVSYAFFQFTDPLPFFKTVSILALRKFQK